MGRSGAVPSVGRPPRGTSGHHDDVSKDAKLVTFINVFTVEPADQRRLVDLLARVTDTERTRTAARA